MIDFSQYAKLPLNEVFSEKNTLFHYTNCEKAIRYIIGNNSLRFSNFSNTNDPNEYRIRQLFFHNKYNQKMTEFINQYVFFLCNCTNAKNCKNNKSYGFNKLRMWAQYGGNHEGVCFMLDKKKLRTIVKRNKGKCYTRSVKYKKTNSYDSISSTFNNIEILNSPFDANKAREFIIKHLDTLFFEKNIDYKDEIEYRIVYICKDKRDPLYLKGYIDVPLNEIIKGLVLGERFPKVYEPLIKNYTKKYQINYYKYGFEHASGPTKPVLYENAFSGRIMEI